MGYVRETCELRCRIFDSRRKVPVLIQQNFVAFVDAMHYVKNAFAERRKSG